MCFTVSSCCGGADLQTGSKAIAIYEIVNAILSMIGYTVLGFAFNQAYGLAFLVQLEIVIVSGLLLYGASTRKSAFVIVWLVIEMMNLIGLFAAAGTAFGFASAYSTYKDSYNKFYGSILVVLGVVLMIYCIVGSYLWTVVYSFNKELKSDNSSSDETRREVRV